jgi:3-oxoacyl-[acyl-carrier protein] reductase
MKTATEDRAVIVTGGSRGIGRAIAFAMGSAGLRVVLSYRERAEEAERVVADLAQAGAHARAVQADVGRPEQCRDLVRQALDAYGRVDVLINNAGTHLPGARLGDMPAPEWDRILNVNLNAPFHLMQAVLPHMRERRSGHIINLSSNVTSRMPANYGAYTVSKAGLEALTRVLAKEEGQNGIRVNAIAPGPIRTDMLNESLDKMGKERAEAFIKSVPLGRMGEPEEIAAVAAFLVSDAASYLTAQVLYVNGGGPGG